MDNHTRNPHTKIPRRRRKKEAKLRRGRRRRTNRNRRRPRKVALRGTYSFYPNFFYNNNYLFNHTYHPNLYDLPHLFLVLLF